MHYTIERLVQGDRAISDYWARAVDLWRVLREENKDSSLEDFGRKIHAAQSSFEQNCGGRWIGQEIMGWAAVAQFYQSADTFGDREDEAVRVVRAFRASWCSSEAKAWLNRAVADYDLEVPV